MRYRGIERSNSVFHTKKSVRRPLTFSSFVHEIVFLLLGMTFEKFIPRTIQLHVIGRAAHNQVFKCQYVHIKYSVFKLFSDKFIENFCLDFKI